MRSKPMFKAVVLAASVMFFGGARAADSSYTPGSVWEFSEIKIEPGQFENYIDWLAGQWKQIQEFEKKQGIIVSYHVLSVNDSRSGEPDLILAVEYKDYIPNAARLAEQKRIEAMLSSDAHKMEAQSGERKQMRKVQGGMELQELILK